MNPTDKAPEIEQAIKQVFGIDRKAIIANDHCVFCDNPNLDFRTSLDQKEYQISGLCQNCQDNVFGKDE